MDAIDFLMDSHRKVEVLFEGLKQGEKLPELQAKDLFDQLYGELSVHTIIEEQVFYPALTKYPGFHDLLKDAYGEHAQARLALSEIAALPVGQKEWQQRINKLSKDINHHVKDEEQDLFPRTRQFVSEEHLQTLKTELEQAKVSQLNSDLLSQPTSEQ